MSPSSSTENHPKPSDPAPPSKPKAGPGNHSTGQGRPKLPTWLLLTLLVLVIGGGLLFMLGVSGGLQPRAVRLDPEYYASGSSLTNSDGDFLELLSVDRYDELVAAQKSFVLFVDQSSCVTADHMRGYLVDYARKFGVKPYRMMFSDLKETSLHEQIKYYPSTIVFSRGKMVKYLDANSDADAAAFNDYSAYEAWLNAVLAFPSS